MDLSHTQDEVERLFSTHAEGLEEFFYDIEVTIKGIVDKLIDIKRSENSKIEDIKSSHTQVLEEYQGLIKEFEESELKYFELSKNKIDLSAIEKIKDEIINLNTNKFNDLYQTYLKVKEELRKTEFVFINFQSIAKIIWKDGEPEKILLGSISRQIEKSGDKTFQDSIWGMIEEYEETLDII